jgi:hypothetical protein
MHNYISVYFTCYSCTYGKACLVPDGLWIYLLYNDRGSTCVMQSCILGDCCVTEESTKHTNVMPPHMKKNQTIVVGFWKRTHQCICSFPILTILLTLHRASSIIDSLHWRPQKRQHRHFMLVL